MKYRLLVCGAVAIPKPLYVASAMSDRVAYKNLSEPSYKPGYAPKIKVMVDWDQYGSSSRADPMFACKPRGVPRGAVGSVSPSHLPIESPKNDVSRPSGFGCAGPESKQTVSRESQRPGWRVE